MNTLTIRSKLHATFVLVLLLLLGLGYFGIQRMNQFALDQLRNVEHVNAISNEALSATILFKKQVQEWKNILIRGHQPDDFKKYSGQFEARRQDVIASVNRLIGMADNQPDLALVAREFLAAHDRLTQQYHQALTLFAAREDGLGYRDVDARVRGIDRPPTDLIESVKDNAETIKQAAVTQARAATLAFRTEVLLESLLIALILLALYIILVETSVLKPIRHLSAVVGRIAQGDFDARANMRANDEIGQLARRFDALLDERLATQKRLEQESARLNASIIELLKSVSVLSQKDLRVKVPVFEDVTGAVSDAINQLSSETAKTLSRVNAVSLRVSQSSEQVKQHSENVIDLARREREETEVMVNELGGAINSLLEVARFTELTNQSAQAAMTQTDQALGSVNDTVESINKIRTIVREIEKRIKRLGERSQEITSAITLINEIAERTHILALNAGMQAAQAGEAGRGFMVVANEVQRLSENSRAATAEISALVKNIQVDTQDTMTTMNTVIAQVVEGTQLAELAGRKMRETQKVTNELVGSVSEITERTQAQLSLGNQLQNRARSIIDSTEHTNNRLHQQSELARSLAEDAHALVSSVQVFKLPA